MISMMKVIDLATDDGLDLHPYAQATYKRIREDGVAGEQDELFLQGLLRAAKNRLAN